MSGLWDLGVFARTALVLVTVSVALPAIGDAQDVPQLTIGRLGEGAPPTIDGHVDDAAWTAAEPYSTFTQQEPNEGSPATERTEVRFLLNAQNLYIAVVSFDAEPDKIVVSQSRRDANLNETDSIQILLDTFNDGQNAFIFGTNPFGIEYDGQVMGEGQVAGSGGGRQAGVGSESAQIAGYNPNWDADFVVRAGMTERGWEAEFAIPLKTLRYNPGEGRVWGVNVMRNIRRKNEQVYLAPIPRGYNLHRVSVAGKLGGLSLPARREIKLVPYATGAVNDEQTLRTDTVDRSGRRRPRCEMGRASRFDARPDGQHRLRPGGSRRAAGEPDAVSAVLSREAPVLPRERPGVSARPAAQHRPVLLAPDRPVRERPADRHPRGRTPERQDGRLQRRRAQHADARCRRRPHGSRRSRRPTTSRCSGSSAR